MTDQHNHSTPLELRVWGTDSPEEEITYEVTMGKKPAVFIRFEGEQGEGLERIQIDSTWFDADQLRDLFLTLASTLGRDPEESKMAPHWTD